jgi:hypothetical protein
MNIPKKKILGDWLTVGENKFKIDYPTRDQKKKLQYILLSLGLTEDDNKHLSENDISSLSSSMQANIVLANKDYQENYLRFTIKDWDLKYEDGEVFKCVLKNGELEEKCWTEFMEAMTPDELNLLYNAVYNEIQFTETDKKK